MTQSITGAEKPDSVALLPCPFCGAGANENGDGPLPYRNEDGRRSILCGNCICEGPIIDHDDDAEAERRAITAWNTRITSSQATPANGEASLEDIRAIDRLLRFHETGGHEGGANDDDLGAVRSFIARALSHPPSPATTDRQGLVELFGNLHGALVLASGDLKELVKALRTGTAALKQAEAPAPDAGEA